jgi:hypothetical protein
MLLIRAYAFYFLCIREGINTVEKSFLLGYGGTKPLTGAVEKAREARIRDLLASLTGAETQSNGRRQMNSISTLEFRGEAFQVIKHLVC